MSPAPKNPRRSALLAVLLLAGAVLVWRLGKPSPPATFPETTPSVVSTATSEQTPSAVAPISADPSALPERPSGPVKREGVDAANLYADAFVLFNQLTDAEKAMIRKPSEEVDAEQAAQLYEKIQAIMELLRAAAKADYCDWGTGEITFETGLPHINKALDLAKLALWAAGYRISTDPAGAIDDLAVRAKLGHHLSDTLIGVLVAANIERGANSLLRQHVGSVDAATLNSAVNFIGSSTIDADLTRALLGEISGVQSIGKKLAGATDDERRRLLLGMNTNATPTPEQRSNAEQLLASIRDPQQLEAQIAFIRGVEEKMADAMRLPEAEFQQWWRGVEASLTDEQWMAKLTLPGVAGVQRSIQQLRVERTLLTAGADILQNGPARIGQYRDPATGGALQYLATATGFELRSPYLAKGKPVTMAFSRP